MPFSKRVRFLVKASATHSYEVIGVAALQIIAGPLELGTCVGVGAEADGKGRWY